MYPAERVRAPSALRFRAPRLGAFRGLGARCPSDAGHPPCLRIRCAPSPPPADGGQDGLPFIPGCLQQNQSANVEGLRDEMGGPPMSPRSTSPPNARMSSISCWERCCTPRCRTGMTSTCRGLRRNCPPTCLGVSVPVGSRGSHPVRSAPLKLREKIVENGEGLTVHHEPRATRPSPRGRGRPPRERAGVRGAKASSSQGRRPVRGTCHRLPTDETLSPAALTVRTIR